MQLLGGGGGWGSRLGGPRGKASCMNACRHTFSH